MLNLHWIPEFGLIYTWYASDKSGKVAVFVNNNFGCIPSVLLRIDGIEGKLDEISEFVLEESMKYERFFLEKTEKLF